MADFSYNDTVVDDVSPPQDLFSLDGLNLFGVDTGNSTSNSSDPISSQNLDWIDQLVAPPSVINNNNGDWFDQLINPNPDATLPSSGTTEDATKLFGFTSSDPSSISSDLDNFFKSMFGTDGGNAPVAKPGSGNATNKIASALGSALSGGAPSASFGGKAGTPTGLPAVASPPKAATSINDLVNFLKPKGTAISTGSSLSLSTVALILGILVSVVTLIVFFKKRRR